MRVYARVHEGTNQRTWNHTSIHDSTWVCRECNIVVESKFSCITYTDMSNIAVGLTWKLVMFECVYIHSVAQRVEVWLKLQPNFDHWGSKFGRSFDQTSTPPSWSFDTRWCGSLLLNLMFYSVNSVKHGYGSLVLKGWSFDGGGRNLVETSTKLRPLPVEIWLKFQLNFDRRWCVLTDNSVKLPHVQLCFSWHLS